MTQVNQLLWILLWALAGLAVMGSPALAHASEQGFVLLLPTRAYIAGGTAAVAASVLVVALIAPARLARLFTPLHLGKARPGGAEGLAVITSLLSTLVFFGLIYVGLRGPHDPQSNLLPLVLWTLWWVALFVVQGMVFDLWRWINPWRGIYALLAGQGGKPLIALPARWGVWPAVLVFLGFQGFVLADVAPSDPDRLARIALAYWGLTLAGMMLCGGRAWLAQVECFTLLFSLMASLRPLRRDDQGRLGLALPGWGALAAAPADWGRSIFCLVILASGSFDGLHETFWWLAQIGINPLEFPGRSAVVWPSLIGLYLANALLIAVFAGAVWSGLALGRLSGGAAPALRFGPVFGAFALCLLPIALGYHFAHYFVTFLVQVQYVGATLADPLARGWSLFGLGDLRVTTGFLNTAASVRAIWLTQAAVVVISHILSVLMAHHLSAGMAARPRDQLIVQAGMIVLMILYTIFGLWLLASPRGV